MKRILIALSITFAMLLVVRPVSSSDVLDNIAAGIRSGSAASLANFFDGNVDITILDKESVYSKAQAQIVLKDFFQKNTVSSFSLLHRGNSAEGSLFGIGTLVTSTQSFRVYYFVKMKKGAYLLQELKFEKPK